MRRPGHSRAAMRATDPAPGPEYDTLLTVLADYVAGGPDGRGTVLDSDLARTTARLSLADALGCGLLALGEPECTKLVGPAVPGTVVPHGVPVPGTSQVLDPVRAAFAIGILVRWLDFNDAWLAAEWGHPSDNIGAILAAAAHASRARHRRGEAPLRMEAVVDAVIRAHEIQGVLALANPLNRVGLDHVLLVRVASAAVAGRLLGASRDQVRVALSHAFADGAPLRTYRHAPNTGSRKSWAAGDATSRGLWLALLALTGEMGYPSVLSAPRWGFQDVLFDGRPLTLARPLGSYVIENVLFKVPHPTEFHAQTALEAAVGLHPVVRDRLDAVDRIDIRTHESAIRIISKEGPLRNPADRDHCLQYIVAVGLIRGALSVADYGEVAAADPRIDRLRAVMAVVEDPQFSADYLDPGRRSVASAVRVHFHDGTKTEEVVVEYPLGHPRRRTEALPHLEAKLHANLLTRFPAGRAASILSLLLDHERLTATPVPIFLEALAEPGG